ncbi:MAG TPA: DUF1614 domain-containing protein [Bacillota bacterium]|nr:DUF1614 domain-containing protein [Bacillota bacterium]
MQVTPFLLTGLAVVIYLGLLQRTLDRMRLSDRAALVIIALMLAGTWLPDVKIGLLSINLGSTLVPLGLAVYLIGTADRLQEQVRALAAIAASTIAVLLLDWVLPQEPGAMFIEPMYAYGLAAGIIGYLAGRSRRSAFLAGMLGILLADTIIVLRQLPLQSAYRIGGGIFDSALIAGIIAVGIAELVGETREFVAPDKGKSKIAWLDEKRREKYRKKNGR